MFGKLGSILKIVKFVASNADEISKLIDGIKPLIPIVKKIVADAKAAGLLDGLDEAPKK